MSMILILSLVLFAAYLSYRLFVYATTPRTWRVAVSELHAYLVTLLRRGYDGSFIIIEQPGTTRFVQLRKYIKDKREIGLELAFPKTTWSASYYSQVERLLEQRKIAFRRRQVSTPPTEEFLDVDFGKDTQTAFAVIEQILTTIFQLSSTATVKATFSNLSLSDELIDVVESPTPSDS